MAGAPALFACNPAPDGGVKVRVTVPGEFVVDIPIAHASAMQLAAALMGSAGVSHATFTNGALLEENS